MKGQAYAVISGLIAAAASLCGKYAVAQEEAEELCENSFQFFDFGYDKVRVYCNEVGDFFLIHC